MSTLKKRLDQYKGKWADELQGVLWSYRTTVRMSIGETPFSLTYDSEAVIATKVDYPSYIIQHATEETNNKELLNELDTINERRDKATIGLAIYQQRVARHYNRNIHLQMFNIGDWVLRRIFQNTKEKGADGMEIGNSWNACHLKQYHF
ncbi:hypothetical protein ACOSQ3_019638 [Xanthoceras sorbifolium]